MNALNQYAESIKLTPVVVADFLAIELVSLKSYLGLMGWSTLEYLSLDQIGQCASHLRHDLLHEWMSDQGVLGAYQDYIGHPIDYCSHASTYTQD